MNTTQELHSQFVQPKCLTEVPGNFSLPSTKFNLSQLWCKEEGVRRVRVWIYTYATCKLGHIHQSNHNGDVLCACYNNLLKDCYKGSPYPQCSLVNYSLLTVLLLLIIIGLILNMMIVTAFYKRSAIRRRIPNILLCNQAIADLFNGGVYGIMCVADELIKVSCPACDVSVSSAFIISLMSSLLLYTVIAIERFLSIYLPLWHRVYLTKKHLWVSVIISWVVSIVLGKCYAMSMYLIIVLQFI